VTVVPSPLQAPSAAGTPLASSQLAAAGLPVNKPWSTPRRLKALRTLLWFLAALLLFVGETTLARARMALRTIAKDTAPSILAAADIGTALADLDANVANALLGNQAHRAAAEAAIEADRVRVSEQILRAAENITYGEAERAPLNALTLDLGRYLEGQAEARLLHDNGDEGTAHDRYWTATDLLHKKLIVSADALDRANKTEMDKAYLAQVGANEGSEVVAGGVGVLLVLALVWTQWFLARRTRRIFNVPLVAATLAGIAVTVYLVRGFSATREDLRVAKVDAFDSIYALIRARAIAYDANGDESRYLLDSSGKRGLDSAWQRNVTSLTTTPDMPEVAVRQLRLAGETGKAYKRPLAQGTLWDEIRNITFDGEYAAAADMLWRFADYYAIDGRIRSLKQGGKAADAIELCIGARPDESNAAFARFDKALQKALDINQAAFDAATASAESTLKRAEILDPGFALLILGLVWLGMRPRLREYAA
jgi:hypothetical protein